LIKQFDFEERHRALITLGVDVRLHPQLERLQLKENALGRYSTAADLYAKTWVANPNSVKQWLGFEAVVQHAYDDLGVPVTELNYRLGDGTDEYYWNGSTWEVNTVDWNTEAEVADNINSFPITEKKIQVIINLVTTDETVTPLLTVVKVLYASDVEFQEDLIYKSLLPLLKSEIRPIALHPVKMPATSDTIDLNDFPLETPYNLDSIDSVYNHNDDPDHHNDLFQSYDPGTQVITLSVPIDVDKIAWIQFVYEPEVAVTTDQEYNELDKVPAVTLESIRKVKGTQFPWPADTVANKAAGTAVRIPSPIASDVEIVMRLTTDKARDQVRLADEADEFFANNKSMISHAMDEKYDICVTSDYDSTTVPGQKGLHSGIILFRIKKALYFQEHEKDTSIVQRFNLVGDLDVTID